MVMDISEQKIVTAMNRGGKVCFEIRAKAVIPRNGMQRAFKRRFKYSRISTGGNLLCRYGSEACKH